MKVVILGGGLAGTAAARELRESCEVLIFEKESRPGGLLKSFFSGGYTFDCGGHLFHFKQPRWRRLFEELMDGNYSKMERRSYVYLMERLLPFPFQANLSALPERVKFECLKDFLDAYHSSSSRPSSFEDWLLKSFGKSMCRYFFFPYNSKFWKIPLNRLSTEWAEWAVPRPSIEQVVAGARGKEIRGLGYNPEFYYPLRGGSQAFFQRFSEGIEFKLGKEAVKVDVKRKEVFFSDGSGTDYDVLISTIPLKDFLSILDGPSQFQRLSTMLTSTSLLVLNLGYRSPAPFSAHWIYFPEERFSFHRLGFYSNFSPFMAPEGGSSLYVEVSFTEKPPSPDNLLDELTSSGWFEGEPEESLPLFLRHAYPHPTREREMAMDHLLPLLEEKDIYLAGRGGTWQYLSMEGVLDQVARLARKLKLKFHL